MQVEIPSVFVAMILKNCEVPYPNHGHVIIANPSPILLYRISSTEIRCLVDIPGKKIPSIGNGDMSNYLKTQVAPQVKNQIYAKGLVLLNQKLGLMKRFFFVVPDAR